MDLGRNKQQLRKSATYCCCLSSSDHQIYPLRPQIGKDEQVLTSWLDPPEGNLRKKKEHDSVSVSLPLGTNIYINIYSSSLRFEQTSGCFRFEICAFLVESRTHVLIQWIIVQAFVSIGPLILIGTYFK